MAHHNFEELEVWKRSARLGVAVLQLADTLTLYALRDQMARSAISIASNIAEGSERDSDKEFRRFLAIAKGSAAELRTQLYLGQRAGLLTAESAAPLIREAKEVSSMIQGLILSLTRASTSVCLVAWISLASGVF
ncbi:four helix bundle protein [Verrucomicrobium spinosum]|jgi:four helix bundle protein|uniref:four helix bundle protein n=1 Tax=Verrucomicrobium spinosum TaxID=2736 RepID=UPI00017448D1|nr:four helix bundle protein [Verrucomicrobium spinosum]